MIYVFPMAGESSRFSDAGYGKPKYQLKLGDKDLFDCVIGPFARFAHHNHFVFICKNDDFVVRFVRQKCVEHAIPEFSIQTVRKKTSGQAETVFLGLGDQDLAEPLLIFNIDTIHSNFVPISFTDSEFYECDGVLEVFEDDGDNWSFAKVEGGFVTKTAEKRPISNLASNGLYYFRSVELFLQSYKDHFKNGRGMAAGERYIAPIYNQIIASGGAVKVKMIDKDDLIFSGTPAEYELARATIEGEAIQGTDICV